MTWAGGNPQPTGGFEAGRGPQMVPGEKWREQGSIRSLDLADTPCSVRLFYLERRCGHLRLCVIITRTSCASWTQLLPLKVPCRPLSSLARRHFSYPLNLDQFDGKNLTILAFKYGTSCSQDLDRMRRLLQHRRAISGSVACGATGGL